MVVKIYNGFAGNIKLSNIVNAVMNLMCFLYDQVS